MSRLPLPVVRVDLAAAGKEAVLRALVQDLHAEGALLEAEEPYRRLLEREAAQSTAMGGGVAIPHARTAWCPAPAFAVARLAPPLDFDATDGIPVDLVFLLLGPKDDPSRHVANLARIAALARDGETMAALRAAPDAASFRSVLDAFFGP